MVRLKILKIKNILVKNKKKVVVMKENVIKIAHLINRLYC